LVPNWPSEFKPQHHSVWSDWMPQAWHWSGTGQVTGVPALQCPCPSQVSPPLQALLSAQLVPAATIA
jgi:hypothetical protein